MAKNDYDVGREASGRQEETQAGIDSVETGMRLLLALSRLGGCQTLTAIAAASGLSPPRAHRYLVSLVRSGMVERDEVRGYRLGPAALEVGVNALASIDALRVAADGILELRDELNHAVAMMVWGHDGPVIVRTEDSNHPVSLRLRVGQPLPVISSASGMILAAYLPWASIRPILERELACTMPQDGGGEPMTMAQAKLALEQTRRRGLSRISDTLTPGIAAFAGPVFDATGKVVLSLSVVAPSKGFDMAWSSDAAQALKACCARVSERLGYRFVGRPAGTRGWDDET